MCRKYSMPERGQMPLATSLQLLTLSFTQHDLPFGEHSYRRYDTTSFHVCHTPSENVLGYPRDEWSHPSTCSSPLNTRVARRYCLFGTLPWPTNLANRHSNRTK